MSSSYWGDLPVIPDTDSGIAAIEREQMTKPRAMEVEGPRLHQPSNRHYPPSTEFLPPKLFAVDPITKHTIELVQCMRKLRQLIHAAQQHYDAVKNSENPDLLQQMNFHPTPTVPEYDGPLPKPTSTFPFITAEEKSDFYNGIGCAPPEIDEIANRRLLRRAVAAIIAHAGFETCNESVLESITDITHEYYLQTTSLVRQAVDHEAQTGSSGFPDVIHRVFSEMGIGSITTIHDFYQNRILNYHQHMIQQCQLLSEEYERMKSPDYKQGHIIRVSKVKEEPSSDIQFPNTEDMDENNDEQLMELHAGLTSLDVEQTGSGGMQQEADAESHETTKLNTFDSFDETSEPPTPYLDNDDIIQPSSTLSDIMSPPSVPPRKKKR